MVALAGKVMARAGKRTTLASAHCKPPNGGQYLAPGAHTSQGLARERPRFRKSERRQPKVIVVDADESLCQYG